MQPHSLLIVCAALFSACSSGDNVQVQVSTSTHTGAWAGTFAENSIVSWTLTESPAGAGFAVQGTGEVRGLDCLVPVVLTGTRSASGTELELTIPSDPSVSISIVGDFAGERFEAIFAIEAGTPDVTCFGNVGGLLRVGPRNDAGLEGHFQGFWSITPNFADTVGPYATMHLVQTSNDVFGTVVWHGDYPCSSGGILRGTFDGEVFLANIISTSPSDAYFFLDSVWDPQTFIATGTSTLLGPGPGPECPLLDEETFHMFYVDASLPLTKETAVEPRPIGVVQRVSPDAPPRVEGLIFERVELPARLDEER